MSYQICYVYNWIISLMALEFAAQFLKGDESQFQMSMGWDKFLNPIGVDKDG